MRSANGATLQRAGSRGDQVVATLASLVLEQLLERTEIRVARRMLDGNVPAVGVVLGATLEAPLPPGMMPELIGDLASLAVTAFIDRGFLAVVRPNRRPVFVHPLPVVIDDVDDVTAMCRQLDEERLRRHVMESAERFVGIAERRLGRRGIAVEVRLTEGALVGEPACVNALLPAARWQPA